MKRCLNCMKEYNDEYQVCPHCGYIEGSEPTEGYYLKPGTVLQNQYVIGTTIGAGGFGIVYRAWDNNLSRMVAVKELFPMSHVRRKIPGQNEVISFDNEKFHFERDIERFIEEARYVAKFSKHPNIINIFNYFREFNTAYIVMEYLDGVTYKEYIKSQGGRIEVESSISVTKEVLKALREVHKEHIVHRDVAPDNIFICYDGRIKLMDFGAARFSKKDEYQEKILKPGFAAPEQYQDNRKQDNYTDLYAVGAVMYRSLTGIMPSEASNRLVQDDLVPPMKVNRNIPEKLNNIVLRAMALQPELRFQSAEEFLKVLDEDYGGRIRTIKEEKKHQKRVRLIKSLTAVAILLACGLIGFFVYDDKKSQIDLKATTLDLWLRANNHNINEEDIIDALEEFTDKYPQIAIQVTILPDNEYESRLIEILDTSSMPDIYEYVNNPAINGKSVSQLSKYIQIEKYTGLNSLEEETLKLPITYKMPVVFVSKIVEGYSEELAQEAYQKQFENGVFLTDENEVERFLNGESAFVVADTSYYWTVQERQGGKYEMLPVIGVDQCQGCYDLQLCINKDSKRVDYYAALQLLFYLLGEKAQSKLCIEQHQNLPLQNDIYKKYIQLNTEYQILEQEREKLVFSN